MKLVEILARELKEWPEGAKILVQDCDLEAKFGASACLGSSQVVWERVGAHSSIYLNELADDWVSAKVTRAEWEAERARILLESQPERDPHIKDLVEIACGKRSKEDQALWDKVAISQMQALTVDGSYDFVRDYSDMYEESDMRKVIAATACDFADAFMAEREKRMKG